MFTKTLDELCSLVDLPGLELYSCCLSAKAKTAEGFQQPDLLKTLQKLVDTEAEALAAGKSRKEAIYAAYDRFYRGDIAEEMVRGSKEYGGLMTMEDLDKWQVHIGNQ